MVSEPPQATIFRFRYKQQGGHTHVRVFAGKSVSSLGMCGELVMRNEEWAALMKNIEQTSPQRVELIEGENRYSVVPADIIECVQEVDP
jgi:hypothetical protein